MKLSASDCDSTGPVTIPLESLLKAFQQQIDGLTAERDRYKSMLDNIKLAVGKEQWALWFGDAAGSSVPSYARTADKGEE